MTLSLARPLAGLFFYGLRMAHDETVAMQTLALLVLIAVALILLAIAMLNG